MRYPAVSGSFYPAAPAALQRQVDGFLTVARRKVPSRACKAIICPHAGFIYSGLTAAHSFAAAEHLLREPNTTVIILGPNHTGLGNPIAVSFDDWKTPVGTSATDLPLAGAIIKANKAITKNEAAHLAEHSIEVQLPFLQSINPHAKIVAICMAWQDDATAKMLAKAIFDVSQKKEFSDRHLLVLASSDFTHYESGERAHDLDAQPLEFIKALEASAFEEEVESQSLSICGHGPIAVALHYAKLAGAKKAELLRYTNSGKETNGDEKSVVAYASFAII